MGLRVVTDLTGRAPGAALPWERSQRSHFIFSKIKTERAKYCSMVRPVSAVAHQLVPLRLGQVGFQVPFRLLQVPVPLPRSTVQLMSHEI